mmetsp:Transcript_449/g.1488  ORF Transcript_449/g.1488 Transcript_449/m.1488 type:complete len:216 (-) Transcript_449:15-662(-)
MGNSQICCIHEEEQLPSEIGIRASVALEEDVASSKMMPRDESLANATSSSGAEVNLFSKLVSGPGASPASPLGPNQQLVKGAEFAPAAPETEPVARSPSKEKREIPETAERTEVLVTRSSLEDELGISLSHCKTHLRIRKIQPDKAIDVHNKKHDGTPLVVKQGDYIMAVNDVTGNDVNMIGECKRSVNLKFSIVNKHAARNSASASHSSQIHSG